MDQQYSLYMIDLDQSNAKEKEDVQNFDELFNIGEPLLQYHENDVGKQKVNAFHVRGSSRKDKIDMNHLCIVFI